MYSGPYPFFRNHKPNIPNIPDKPNTHNTIILFFCHLADNLKLQNYNFIIDGKGSDCKIERILQY